MALHLQRSRPTTSRPAKAAPAVDANTPPALVDFMMQSWKPASPAAAAAKVKGHARYAVRRQILSRAFRGSTLVIPSGHEKVRANDTVWRFRCGTDFYYLTGNQEPDCVLVLLAQGRTHEAILFVEPNPGRGDPTFFTDRAKGELWVGPRLGLAGSAQRYQVDRCEPIASLPGFLKGLRGRRQGVVRMVRGLAPDIDKLIAANDPADDALATFLSEQRLIKDEMEIAAIKRACAATRSAFDDVVRSLRTATTERELEGAFNRRARMEGNDVGFNTIVAAGPHACILHWTANDGRLRKRDLVLVDAGVETNEIYTGDITRTLPVSGKFTAGLRELYDLVVSAQDAAFAAVKPGNDFQEPHWAAMRVLAEGLEKLGILSMPAEVALRRENMFYKRYTLHNTSHMLGLDVHDGARAKPQAYRQGKLRPGMVLTVEPGLYFQLDDLTVPPRFRGIGIRVEDDVLVTTRGCQLLSNVPRLSDDVERWIRRLWQLD